MSFFDEGDEPTRVTRPSRPRRGGGGSEPPPRAAARQPDRRTLLIRQAVGIGGFLLFVLLIGVGIQSCRSNQQENALKDYNREVTSVVTSSDRDVGRPFFELLGSGSDPAQDLQVQVNQLRLAADEDARRARRFDVPGPMEGAQDELLLALDFRAEALRRIADTLPTALGRGQPAEQALSRIAGQMQKFLASDVVYNQRVAPLIKEGLDEEGITGQRIPNSQFMPNVAWLSPEYVAERLGSDAGGQTDEPAPGLHGHGLTSVAVGDNTLQPSPVVNRVPATGRVTFHVTFANQGDNDERNVRVSITVRGGGRTLTARKTVAQTKAGSPAEVDVPLSQTPPVGTATVDVVVNAVRGEGKTDNNRQRYTVIFTR
ncbi:MAG TPA: hypothetical protein VHF51_07740 [Solirubrobacteraceae bacterium]|nr:hypothetical protein [Solirubrobacteraceae bacterium]